MGKPAAMAATDQERVLLEACSLSPEDCFTRLGSREKGLTEEEVEEKRREFGTNEVSTKQGGAAPADLPPVRQSPGRPAPHHRRRVSFIMGDLRSTIVVGGMVLISVGLSSIQEERSGRSVEKLQAMVRTTVNVHAGREGIGDPAGADRARGRGRPGRGYARSR